MAAHRNVEMTEIELMGGRLLRVEVHRQEDGSLLDVLVCIGRGVRGGWLFRPDAILFDAEALEGLREVLERLG